MTAELFSGLYEEGLPRTIRFLLSLGFQRDTATEIAQAAWSRAWERIDQLRDQTKILSWVNTIALNDARKTSRRARQHVSFTPGHERVTLLNVAAIDVAKILDLCTPKDREILQAHLEGSSNLELAGEQGISETAMRLRSFRARRAARSICQPAYTFRSVDHRVEARLNELTQKFYDQCLTLARQHLDSVETFLRLLDLTPDNEKREKLRGLIAKGINNTLRSVSRVSSPSPEVTQILSSARSLSKRLLEGNGAALRKQSAA